MDAATGRLLDCEMGSRSIATLRRLYKRLEAQFKPTVYATDGFKAYTSVIPEQRLAQSKVFTWRVEQHNSNTRHWLARFRRKSKVVSRCAEMVRLSILLLETIHVSNILKLLI